MAQFTHMHPGERKSHARPDHGQKMKNVQAQKIKSSKLNTVFLWLFPS